MALLRKNLSVKEQLKRTKSELAQLKQAKKVIETEKPSWKKYHSLNLQREKHRNAILETSESSYPWFSSLERDTIYNTFTYLQPYSIHFYHLYLNKKPYKVFITTADNQLTKTKHFKSLNRALKYIKKTEKKIEKEFSRRVFEIDKVILSKEKELIAIEKANSILSPVS